MCWEPVRERMPSGSLRTVPRARFSPRTSMGQLWLGAGMAPARAERWGQVVAGGLPQVSGWITRLWKQKQERRSRPGAAAAGPAERAALQTGLHPRASAGGSSSAENSFQSGCFSVFRSCSFCRDRPWRKLASEQPSQGPPAALPESLDRSACPPVLWPAGV